VTEITDHLAVIERRVAAALSRAGRGEHDVMLVAVSKGQPAAAIAAAHAAGLRDFGENYVDEALEKMDSLADLDIRWHFIGRIQSNKTRTIAERFDWVHTVDRERIAARLNSQRPDDKSPLNVLIQVNLANESQKGGVPAIGLPPLAAAIDNALSLVKERAQRHGLTLSCEVDPALDRIRADERKVKQVVLNLLSNAVKFTPDGGSISVRATLDTDCVEVAVRDTGIGIAPEDQAAVFEEFTQVGRDYTKKAEGTGLGLALTKRIVELHGGRIWVESIPDRGTTFTIALPL